MDVQKIVDKLKAYVQKGNVSRIIVRRQGREILNVPVSVGIVGAAIGISAAKWAVLAAVLATIGFGCTVEIQKLDGAVVSVMDEEGNRKIHEYASEAVEKVKESIPVSISVDIHRDDEVAGTAGKNQDDSDERLDPPV